MAECPSENTIRILCPYATIRQLTEDDVYGTGSNEPIDVDVTCNLPLPDHGLWACKWNDAENCNRYQRARADALAKRVEKLERAARGTLSLLASIAEDFCGLVRSCHECLLCPACTRGGGDILAWKAALEDALSGGQPPTERGVA